METAAPTRRSLPQLRIASPCQERWDAMHGTDRVRFCDRCEKHVYNLSAMSAQEADALLTRTRFGVCVRMFQRADGTVLSSDCPVGVRAKRRSLWAGASMLVAAVTSAFGCGPTSAVRDLGDAGADDGGTVEGLSPAQERWTRAFTLAYERLVQGQPAVEPPAAEPPHAIMGKIAAPRDGAWTMGEAAPAPQDAGSE